MDAFFIIVVYLLLCHCSACSAGLKAGTPDYWMTFVLALVFTPILVFIYALALFFLGRFNRTSNASSKKKKDDGGIGFISKTTGVDLD